MITLVQVLYCHKLSDGRIVYSAFEQPPPSGQLLGIYDKRSGKRTKPKRKRSKR